MSKSALFSGISVWILAIALFAGCSSMPAADTTSPSMDGAQSAQDSNSTILGEFNLTLDPETMEAKIEPVNRTGAFDVTGYVTVNILGLNWDEASRIWNIDFSVHNPSKYIGYGAWVVFRNTGDQKILDQDGFTWWRVSPGGPTKRVPVIALGKSNPQRAFYSTSTEYGHLRIHWPAGVNSFSPMYFVIDANYPGPRQEPIVEQLDLTPSMIPENMILTAFVKDWQTNSGTPPLNVFVDLTPLGGSWNEPLYDDGMHGDGLPNDDIWGTGFYAMTPDPVILVVYAEDSEGFHFENEIQLKRGGPDCVPLDWYMDGSHSGIKSAVENVITDEDTWKAFWVQHTSIMYPPPELPRIDFDNYLLITLMTGGRSTGGYWIEVNCVDFQTRPLNERVIVVDYTEFIPGDGCMVPQVFTEPYAFFTIEKDYYTSVEYIQHDFIYDCD